MVGIKRKVSGLLTRQRYVDSALIQTKVKGTKVDRTEIKFIKFGIFK